MQVLLEREVDNDGAQNAGLAAVDVKQVDGLGIDAADLQLDIGATEVAAETQHAVTGRLALVAVD